MELQIYLMFWSFLHEVALPALLINLPALQLIFFLPFLSLSHPLPPIKVGDTSNVSENVQSM